MTTEVINSVLANLEESAVFRSCELRVSALLGRLPTSKEDVNLRSEEKHVIIYVNDAYPRCDFKWKKEPCFTGARVIKMTPFLKLNSRVTDKFSSNLTYLRVGGGSSRYSIPSRRWDENQSNDEERMFTTVGGMVLSCTPITWRDSSSSFHLDQDLPDDDVDLLDQGFMFD